MANPLTRQLPPEDQRRRELAWRRASAENVAAARRRFTAIAERIGLPPDAEGAFVAAAMEVARGYAMECSYANYELRTGHAWPGEDREVEESLEERQWRGTLERLERAVRARAEPPPA